MLHGDNNAIKIEVPLAVNPSVHIKVGNRLFVATIQVFVNLLAVCHF